MRKIRKGLSLILIMIFSCQNVAFCLPEGDSTLRLPINGSPRVGEAMEWQKYRLIQEEVLNSLLKPNLKLLDIGTKTGLLLKAIAAMNQKAEKLVGIDLAIDKILKFSENNVQIELRPVDARSENWRDLIEPQHYDLSTIVYPDTLAPENLQPLLNVAFWATKKGGKVYLVADSVLSAEYIAAHMGIQFTDVKILPIPEKWPSSEYSMDISSRQGHRFVVGIKRENLTLDTTAMDNVQRVIAYEKIAEWVFDKIGKDYGIRREDIINDLSSGKVLLEYSKSYGLGGVDDKWGSKKIIISLRRGVMYAHEYSYERGWNAVFQKTINKKRILKSYSESIPAEILDVASYALEIRTFGDATMPLGNAHSLNSGTESTSSYNYDYEPWKLSKKLLRNMEINRMSNEDIEMCMWALRSSTIVTSKILPNRIRKAVIKKLTELQKKRPETIPIMENIALEIKEVTMGLSDSAFLGSDYQYLYDVILSKFGRFITYADAVYCRLIDDAVDMIRRDKMDDSRAFELALKNRYQEIIVALEKKAENNPNAPWTWTKTLLDKVKNMKKAKTSSAFL
ncbi:MAG: 50S ribosomal protein L11 methyltransferase [Candidatus Omnitrophica bacterium]|nr:50S ribosomal protein L11 methyltransferase [Candidatus Omnitrophota bacterium]